jgi:predicted DNA-binding protein
MIETMTSLRMPMDLLSRADALADTGIGTGARVSRAVVLRRALELGIATMERETAGAVDPLLAELRAELAELRVRVTRLELR